MSTSTSQSMLLSERIARSSIAELQAPALPLAPTTPSLVFKRVIDIVSASLGILALAPVMLLVALAVRFSSRGPILFRQIRLGLGGRPFYVLKFRTMVIDAERRLAELESKNEAAGGVLFKIRHDPRITPIGGFLRRTSLDELPQLFNVLRGEMSLVGPRPLQLRDSHLLEASDPQAFARRLSVLPGISGPWQISGRSDGADSMVCQDLDYVENWSLGLDLKILIRTIPVVLSRRGAC